METEETPNSATLSKGLLYLSLLAAGAGWIVLYMGSFQLLLSRWNTEDYSYCYLVPFLALYIAYGNRSQLKELKGLRTLPGYIGIALAALTLLAGSLGSLETFVYLSMWLSLASALILLMGMQSLWVNRFSLFILLFAIPAPPFITQTVTFKLRLLSSAISVKLLQLLGISAYREGNIIDLGITKLQVVDACSGLRYVLPTILLALVIGYLFNKKFWERALLAVLSLPIAVFANSLRIVAMALLGKHVSAGFVEEGFLHDLTGWFVFMFILGFLMAVSFVFRRLSRGAVGGSAVTSSPDDANTKSVTDRPVYSRSPWVHGLVAGGLFLALHFAQAHLVSSQTVPSRSDFSTFPLQVGDWEGKRDYLSEEILNALWADDYVLATYRNRVTGNSLMVLIPYYKYQTTQHTAHAPASCLLGGGWSITNKRAIPPDPAAGRSFPVHQMVLEKGGQVMLSNFWFQQRGRIITDEYMNKAYLFWDAITRRRTDGALVRLELAMAPGQSLEKAQAILDDFASRLTPVLNAYIPD
jgi:exosortase D (VPLPA-CTERM-specific)